MQANHVQHLLDLFSLNGKTAIITGAGGGLGREIARLYALAGANVVIADLKVDLAKAAASEINAEQARGEIALAVACDVSNEASVISLFAATIEKFGAVDILVNCAGRMGKTPFVELTPEQFDSYHAVNSRGVFLCMREAVIHMRAAGNGGSIINVSSVSSLRAATYENSGYGASKGGVNALTTSIALEVGEDNIRVNAILPGAFPVERNQKSMAARAVPLKGPLTNVSRVPLGRYGKGTELANVALFLASPAASYITGHLLPVDGGFLIS